MAYYEIPVIEINRFNKDDVVVASSGGGGAAEPITGLKSRMEDDGYMITEVSVQEVFNMGD